MSGVRAFVSLMLMVGSLALLPVRWGHGQVPPDAHPDTSGEEWSDLFLPDLSDAFFPPGAWRVESAILTASEDEVIWSGSTYDRFILDLEFKNAPGANSGVIIHASDIEEWVPNSIEIQIADDSHDQWADAPGSRRAGAVFGHVAPSMSMVKPPGEWNRLTITAFEDTVWVMLNGAIVSHMNMSEWTSAELNPDGTEIPPWLSRPVADLPREGYVGLQGMHGDAQVWFRRVRIRPLQAVAVQ